MISSYWIFRAKSLSRKAKISKSLCVSASLREINLINFKRDFPVICMDHRFKCSVNNGVIIKTLGLYKSSQVTSPGLVVLKILSVRLTGLSGKVFFVFHFHIQHIYIMGVFLRIEEVKV